MQKETSYRYYIEGTEPSLIDVSCKIKRSPSDERLAPQR